MKKVTHELLNSKTFVRFLVLVAVLSTFGAVTPLSTATAPPLTITVVNNSGWEIRYLYLSPANNDEWGPDQLNDSSISSGATRTLNIAWDQSTVKLVAEDSDGCFLYQTVEASGNPVWTIASDATRNCGN
jgi:hypothetical protein